MLTVRISRITVEHPLTNIRFVGSQCNVKTIRSATHGKEESATYNKIPDVVSNGQFQLRNFCKPKPGSISFGICNLVDIPGFTVKISVEFSVLSREILVMQMQPVVFRENSHHNCRIVNFIVRNLGIIEYHGHGIIPGQSAAWCINGNLRSFLQLNNFHIDLRVRNFRLDCIDLSISYNFITHSTDNQFFFNGF
ncbi:hypothetical protein D3C86_1319290 [compost metagenome]